MDTIFCHPKLYKKNAPNLNNTVIYYTYNTVINYTKKSASNVTNTVI